MPRRFARRRRAVGWGLAWVVLVVVCAAAASGVAAAQQPAGQRPQDEFVPVRDLGQQEQLAAAPLLVAAYVFVWLALLAYLWSIWRRLGKVDRELGALSRRLVEKGGGGRPA